MNKRTSDQWNSAEDDGELLASFGEARLIRINGRICLQGGAMADRMEALEWMALFMPDEPVNEFRRERKV